MRWLGQNEEDELGSKRGSSREPFGLYKFGGGTESCGRSWVRAVQRLGEMLTGGPTYERGQKKKIKRKGEKRGGRGCTGLARLLLGCLPRAGPVGLPCLLFLFFSNFFFLVPFITFAFELQISSTSF
jgi:hypothetical protein